MQMITKVTLLVLGITTVVYGHSHLASPLPTRRLDCRVGNGRPRACHGPCPPLDRYGNPTGISANRPSQTWRRGEGRWVSWHRNNHGKGESGFVRFTLVPVNKMMNKAAHQKFTFQISCWSSGLHRCHVRNAKVCGNDAEGKAYRVQITVPTAYPDGVYVFGWAWYGGGDFAGKSFFGDYYSCSFVRIKGGQAVSAESRPVFYPGLNQKFGDSCLSATDRVGVCWKEPCHKGPVRRMRPKGLPGFIRSRDLGYRAQPQRRPAPRQNRNARGNAAGARKRGSRITVTGVDIYDVKTNRVRLMKGHHFSIKVSDYRSGFTVGLRASGDISKVIFRVRGRLREEKKAPYIVNGNQGRRLARFPCGKGEEVRIETTTYGHDGRKIDHNANISCI